MSIKLIEEYGDAINVVFVEVGRATETQMQQFALKRKWLGNPGMWTKEAPFETGLSYIPASVLIDSGGKVLLVDNPIERHGDIVDMIEADLEAARKGPKDVPSAVGKAWGDFGKGNYAKALAAAQAVIDKPGRDAETETAAAKAAIDAFKAQIEAKLARAQLLADNGLLAQADELLKALAKGLKGSELAAKADELVAKLASDDYKAEREAADALGKIEKKLYAKGPDDGMAKSLNALAEKYAGTKSAERARQLAEVATESEGE